MHNLEVIVEEPLKRLGAYLYYVIVYGVRVKCRERELLEAFIRETVDKVKEAYGPIEKLKDVDKVRAYRKFLWRLGIDPTKTRPSSEALVRRVLRGLKFPRINDIVDIGNAVSAYTLIPIGLYDLDNLSPPLRLVLSKGGEVFKGIGSEAKELPKGIPILVDSLKKVLHIFPHRDSLDTAVTERTRNLLITGAGVEGVPEIDVKNSVVKLAEMLLELKCSERYEGPWRSR
jgi:DNA/RNA-binding domain of Phe-tRNA-synthetase-like protein